MRQYTHHKHIIYQVLTRLFSNQNTTNQPNGTLAVNACGKFNEITDQALSSIKRLGITHLWYTGIIHHAQVTDYTAYHIPLDHPSIVKGIAGSPYAIKDYYDVNPDLAVDVTNRMQEFEALVDRTHQHDLKVIIDFVPNHVARTYKSLQLPALHEDLGANDNTEVAFDPQNNFYYLPNQTFKVPNEEHNPSDNDYVEFPAKATGNDVFNASPSVNDWYETIKLNYGIDYVNGGIKHFDPIPSTWIKMKDILVYWAAKGVDGFRCDMAEMVPVEFWKWAISAIKGQFPSVIFIAEIYNPSLYQSFIHEGGFDYLYDKVSLYNRLRPLVEGHGNAEDLTWVWQNETGAISKHMLRFLENHDEQRIASHFFAKDPLRALPAMTLCATMNEGPFMLYFGQELGIDAPHSEGFQGNDGRTTIFDYWGIEEMQSWINKGAFDELNLPVHQKNIRDFYQRLCHLALTSDAIREGGFYDLQYVNNNGQSPHFNQHKLFTYLRHTDSEQLLFLYNFDLHTSYQTFVKIPLQVSTDILQLNPTYRYYLESIFSNREEDFVSNTPISLGEIEKSGFAVSLPANSVYIVKIVQSAS